MSSATPTTSRHRGSNPPGPPYVPTFWRDIGPFLPSRNANILLHNTPYFHGNGTTQALVVLLVYAGILTIALGLIEWVPTSSSPVTPETEVEATAMVVPVAPP